MISTTPITGHWSEPIQESPQLLVHLVPLEVQRFFMSETRNEKKKEILINASLFSIFLCSQRAKKFRLQIFYFWLAFSTFRRKKKCVFKFLFVLWSNKKQNRIAFPTACDLKRVGNYQNVKVQLFLFCCCYLRRITYCSSSLTIDSFHLRLVECFAVGLSLRSSEVFSLKQYFVNNRLKFEALWPLPIAKNISLTLTAVLADVSINSNPFSSAYCFASS